MSDRPLLIPFRSSLLPQIFVDSLVVGSGVAGLRAAIGLGDRMDVILLAKEALDLSSTSWAQGGIAAAIDPRDTLESHEADTLEAGAGLCEPRAVRLLVEQGAREVRQLLAWGMRVDRQASGEPALGLEGGHQHHRILHSDGDATGTELARCLIERARRAKRLRIFDRCFALDILVDTRRGQRRAAGVLTWHPRHGLQIIWARSIVLATGGCGQLWRETSNPRVATGDGVAMAWRAGATLADLEFMQFHPTTLYVAGAPRHLISEAVRGEGALLVDRQGRSIMDGVDARGPLATRDVVSRAITSHMARTGESHVLLDARSMGSEGFRTRFPGLARMLGGFGLDAGRDLVPVHPAAHYFVGGVRTDLDGRTDLPGLYACGEAAATGVHGANRLASNSLLEGLVFGARAAEAIAADDAPQAGPFPIVHEIERPDRGELDLADIRSSLRSAMWRNVGVERQGTRLQDVLGMFEFWNRYALEQVFESPEGWEVHNMLTVGRLVTESALARTESRGTHARSDFPDTRSDLAGHFLWRHSEPRPSWSPVGELAPR
ncbi:MAG: L-aspartate oxidase [Planctomycetes bacterium]|nr:L-aspartate oxidase [Planctomycetota bacterium]